MSIEAIIARVFGTVLGLWSIYCGFSGSDFRVAVPGTDKKGPRVPTLLGRVGFIAVGFSSSLQVSK